jgi:hypothetical protein
MGKLSDPSPSLIFPPEIVQQSDNTDNYAIGGYHPGYIGEIFNDRYVLLRKLAQGQYSSVWLAKDLKFDINVSLKIYKSSPCYNEIAIEELETLRALQKKAREKEWQLRLEQLRLQHDLPDNISPRENFCVK